MKKISKKELNYRKYCKKYIKGYKASWKFVEYKHMYGFIEEVKYGDSRDFKCFVLY